MKYVSTIFNLFDVTGDGEVEVKEFAYVSTKMAHKSGGFGSYTDLDQAEVLTSSSGLLNYLFGKNRDGTLTKEKFCKLQNDLLEEIIELEFKEYDKGNTGRISEADFVKFLLKNGKLTPKKRE
jgi:Ca2+-binding EF-hand superfamily protein